MAVGKAFKWTPAIQSRFQRHKKNYTTWRSLAIACGISPSTLLHPHNARYLEKFKSAVMVTLGEHRKKALDVAIEILSNSASEDMDRLKAAKIIIDAADKVEDKEDAKKIEVSGNIEVTEEVKVRGMTTEQLLKIAQIAEDDGK